MKDLLNVLTIKNYMILKFTQDLLLKQIKLLITQFKMELILIQLVVQQVLMELFNFPHGLMLIKKLEHALDTM